MDNGKYCPSTHSPLTTFHSPFTALLFPQPKTINQKPKTLHKLAEHPNELPFAANNIAVVEVAGKKICIGRHQDKYFAFAYKCPHAGGLLAHGNIDALGRVVCPLHRYRFNPQNGMNVSGEGFYLRHWPVENREDGVYLLESGEW